MKMVTGCTPGQGFVMNKHFFRFLVGCNIPYYRKECVCRVLQNYYNQKKVNW